ncbi:hypothetical protein [Mycobacterium sp. E796]|uniref:hypothetical protein n=1 Tax=Mycobacterium sp. E796 TaxID=1834151 RepID=UPI0012EACC74|nr:hypothetical protein [Mycobacterium sp. E796]
MTVDPKIALGRTAAVLVGHGGKRISSPPVNMPKARATPISPDVARALGWLI